MRQLVTPSYTIGSGEGALQGVLPECHQVRNHGALKMKGVLSSSSRGLSNTMQKAHKLDQHYLGCSLVIFRIISIINVYMFAKGYSKDQSFERQMISVEKKFQ